MENIKLFTHTDLDGIGCAILAKLAFMDVNITYCSYNDIDENVLKFINSKDYQFYDYVYITDISIKKETAEVINNCHPEKFKSGFNLNEMFQLLDHHATALELNEYFWCNVQVEENGEKTSGTQLFYNNLLENEYLKRKNSLDIFVDNVNQYDTWLWFTKYKNNTPKMWNDLYYVLGKEKFINYVKEKIYKDDFSLDSFAVQILELEQNKIDNYVKAKDQEIIKREILGKKFGIVFAEFYVSELGNSLCLLHPELDFIAIINMKGFVSLRSNKKDLNLGQDIAKLFGGGGHFSAAGFSFESGIQQNVVDSVFKFPMK
jgi:oligoribonuclease NrnB/cAMP/cGMP phosphodiesterase (DHH superfamily)